MDTLPNQSDAQFQAFLAKLLEQPQPAVWGEKQQIELDMARELAVEMLQLAERMNAAHTPDLENCLVLLRHAKVLDFILSSLAARRDIHPRTLRTIFKLAKLKVHDSYPGEPDSHGACVAGAGMRDACRLPAVSTAAGVPDRRHRDARGASRHAGDRDEWRAKSVGPTAARRLVVPGARPRRDRAATLAAGAARFMCDARRAGLPAACRARLGERPVRRA